MVTENHEDIIQTRPAFLSKVVERIKGEFLSLLSRNYAVYRFFPEGITVDIEITAEIIAESKPRQCCCCPVSISIRRATGLHCSTFPDQTTVYPKSGKLKKALFLIHSADVKNMITNYDTNGGIEPCTLQVYKGSPTGKIRLKGEDRLINLDARTFLPGSITTEKL